MHGAVRLAKTPAPHPARRAQKLGAGTKAPKTSPARIAASTSRINSGSLAFTARIKSLPLPCPSASPALCYSASRISIPLLSVTPQGDLRPAVLALHWRIIKSQASCTRWAPLDLHSPFHDKPRTTSSLERPLAPSPVSPSRLAAASCHFSSVERPRLVGVACWIRPSSCAAAAATACCLCLLLSPPAS